MTHRENLNKKVAVLYAVALLGVASVLPLVFFDKETLLASFGFDVRPWLRLGCFVSVCNVGLRVLKGFQCPGCGQSIRLFSKNTPLGFRFAKEGVECQHCSLNLNTTV
jgi:hypothetical protein